jgi:hypothetical protein
MFTSEFHGELGEGDTVGLLSVPAGFLDLSNQT